MYVYLDTIHPEYITIEDNCTIGLRSSIFTHFYWGPRNSKGRINPVHIESDVFIGPYCGIFPGVRIGKGAVIQAGTMITRDVPAWTFIGKPNWVPLARVTTPLTRNHSYDEFIHGLRPIKKTETDIE